MLPGGRLFGNMPRMPKHTIRISPSDVLELELFPKYLERRRTHPDEPASRSYAEIYGTVVYEAPTITPVGNLHDRLAEVCHGGGDCDPE